jgi:hypothetical protein
MWIASLPNAEHIEYAIAKDADLARRLAKATDVEFGMIVSQLAPASAVASPASTARTESPTVPKPYQPVGSGSSTTVIPSSALTQKAGHDFDKSGYREQRAKERAQFRRR